MDRADAGGAARTSGSRGRARCPAPARQAAARHRSAAVAEQAATESRAGFWKAESLDDLRHRVGAANAAIVSANVNLVAADQLDLFDWNDVRTRWQAMRAGSVT